MRLFVGLIIIGIVLLSASFYLGARFFDGKVDEDTYSTALRYDEQNHLIKKHGIAIEVNKIQSLGNKARIEGNVKSSVSLNIVNIQVEYPASDKKIIQSLKKERSSFVIELENISKGNYDIVAEALVDNRSVKIEKPIYIN